MPRGTIIAPVTRLPSLDKLLALDAAARHGSYSAAAQELGLTHGAISHRIRELEEGLHVTLFQRAGRTMAPTREAVSLLAQVREALALLRRAFPPPLAKGEARLAIGLHPTIATRWLIPRLGAFLERHPAIAVELRSTADLEDFLSPEVDIAIRYGAGGWPDAHAERLAGEVLFPVCTPAYRDAVGLVTPADLHSARLLRHAWQPWGEWLRAAKVDLPEPTGGLTLSDSAMLLQAALAGQGVALARGRFVVDDIKAGRLVRPFAVEIADSYAYYLLSRDGVVPSAATLLFGNWLRAQFDHR